MLCIWLEMQILKLILMILLQTHKIAFLAIVFHYLSMSPSVDGTAEFSGVSLKITDAATKAFTKFEKYYNQIDMQDVYLIAACCDPQLKNRDYELCYENCILSKN